VELRTYPNDTLPPELDAQVLALLQAEYPELAAGRTQRSLNDPRTNPTLMVLLDGEEVLSYLAIPSKTIQHAGEEYRAYGLSSVITNPAYRRRGYGRRIVTAAHDFIAASDADIGVFTSDPPLVDFYLGCGWSLMAGTWLVGGSREKPFPSNELGKCTYMGFFSEKARAHRADFEGVPIYLDLREGDLW
jgi:GNAT superfamily N-acetyltransferase